MDCSCNGLGCYEKIRRGARASFFYADIMKGGMMELTLNSTVCLHTIQFRKEQKNYIVKDTIENVATGLMH